MVSSLGQLISPASLENQADISGLPSRITQAIKNASNRTGVDFTYLLKKAQQESGFDASAKSSSSSATGLYQFTSQTWLRMVKTYGAQYGLGTDADSIKIDSSGVAHVNDAATRKAILALRNDPQISAEMAGELDKENAGTLQENVGGKIGATELYLAHFLGAGGASDFLNEMRANPTAKASAVLPDAAAANPSVFYNSAGEARSLKQIYQHFAQKFDSTGSNVMVASAAPAASTALSAAAIYASAKSAGTGHASSLSAANPISVATANNAITAMGQLKASGNSLMATMILAQMNFGDMGSPASLTLPGSSAQHKKDELGILSASA